MFVDFLNSLYAKNVKDTWSGRTLGYQRWMEYKGTMVLPFLSKDDFRHNMLLGITLYKITGSPLEISLSR